MSFLLTHSEEGWGVQIFGKRLFSFGEEADRFRMWGLNLLSKEDGQGVHLAWGDGGTVLMFPWAKEFVRREFCSWDDASVTLPGPHTENWLYTQEAPHLGLAFVPAPKDPHLAENWCPYMGEYDNYSAGRRTSSGRSFVISAQWTRKAPATRYVQ